MGAGQANLDSLFSIWNDHTNSDSVRLTTMNEYVWSKYMYEQPDSAYYYLQQMQEVAIANKHKKFQASILSTMGVSFVFRANHEEAIKHMMKSLKLNEEISDTFGIANALGNIGNIYADQENYEKAAPYFEKSLALRNIDRDKDGIGGTLHNLAICYHQQGDLEKALKYNRQSLRLKHVVEDVHGIAVSYNNMGNIYADMSKHDSALIYYNKALEIFNELGYKKRIAETTDNIGSHYLEMKDYSRAIHYSTEALELAQSIKSLQNIKGSARTLYLTYKESGNQAKALEMFELFVEARDSLAREENQNELIKQEYKYKYEQEQALAQKAHELELRRQQDVARVKQTRQYVVIGAIGVGLVIVIIFSISLFKRYKLTEYQKLQIQEKNKEITDSITYAQRIQEAILPPVALMNRTLPKSFVLYKPKDIVAGDFYWLEPQGDSVLFAAADCTGHGVPGAMVSVVCHNALNRSVREFGLTEPGKILDKCRELVISTFERSDQEMQDGMDIALCRLNLKTGELQFAGAHNGLLLIRSGSTDIQDLEMTRGDKQPIGMYSAATPFTTHKRQMNTGDSLYILTDGYQDQFGGPKGKKFMFKRLKNLLFENHKQPLEAQRISLDRAFEEWKHGLEQIDDVCVIGVQF